jgi:hypothetical protein
MCPAPAQLGGPLTGPDDIRDRFARHGVAHFVAELASRRPPPGGVVGCATPIALPGLRPREATS